MKIEITDGDKFQQALKDDPSLNLILNMSAGLLPEHLTKEEVEILKTKHGDDWFNKLGYTEPEYKQPKEN